MSRLDELIAELCPDGIEYKTLGECTQKISNIKWKNTTESFKYIDLSSVDRETHSIIETILIDSNNAPSRAQQIVKFGDILFGATRPLLGRYCIITKEYDNQVCSTGFCVLRSDKSILNSRWIYHIISSDKFMNYVEKHQCGASYPTISDADVKKYKIPVPPLPVQEEIVRILDTFSELTAELTAELTKRKQQYQYYRINLFQIEKKNIRTIGDVCKFQNGFAFKSNLFKEEGKPILRIVNIKNDRIILDNVVFFNLSDYRENLEQFIVRNGDFVVAMSGATTGKVGINYTGRELFLNQRVGMFIAYENIMHKRYLYHFLVAHSETIYQMASGSGAQPNLSSETLKKMKIPVPPLEEQKRIVAILDRFDALCNDLTSGLPAEIEARKKQYAYYRDKLLTFKEAV